MPADRAVVRLGTILGDAPSAGQPGAERVISESVDARDGTDKVHIQIETADGHEIWARDFDAVPADWPPPPPPLP